MSESNTVAFLFTDLVNSTEHLQRAGEEAAHQMFRAHHKLLTDAVKAAGGQELQWLGDGVLAVFSSSAEAVRCAIQVQQTARRPASNANFGIRIGIHAGEAMRRDGGYFGTPVVTARRLCDSASTGQILCSRLIADLLTARNAFTLRDLGVLDLKGLMQPMAVCEVAYEKNDPAALLSRTPFVGRAAQIMRLNGKLDIASSGHGTVVTIVGEPGIGKTRILDEFSDLARQRGMTVLRGSCYDGEFQAPYGPFTEAIIDYAGHAPAEELKAALEGGAPTLARIAPALRRQLGDIPEPAPLDKDEERFRVLDAVAQTFIALSRTTPLVVIADDMHWADKGTVAMFSHTAHFVPSHSILLIGAYRESEVGKHHPLAVALGGIKRLRDFENIALKGLDGSEVAELLSIVGDEDPPDALVNTISNETDGNPFFIREVLLNLVEEGKILQDSQGWRTEVNIESLRIPEGVREVINRRTLRLSDHTRGLLTVGSAFKGPFSFEVASAVAGLDEDAALAAADEALDARLLRCGTGADTFDFTHALIRHTLYSELNSVRRVRLHRQIAEAMERQWGDRASEHAAEVAYQFWRGAAATGTAKGADYAIAAADNAEKAYAHDDAVAFLRIAVELLPDSDSRRREVLTRLGLALTWASEGDEAISITRQAIEMTAEAQGAAAAAEHCEKAARAMFSAGHVRGAWEIAHEGISYLGDRRDITWASLTEIDILREESEASRNPGIRLDTPRHREWRRILRSIPKAEVMAHGIDPAVESREEIVEDPDAPPSALLNVAGDFKRSLPMWEVEAGEAERKGRIAWAMAAWAAVARCHTAMGNFSAAQAGYDRALALSVRTAGHSIQAMSLYAARQDMLLALDTGWEELQRDQSVGGMVSNPRPEARWAFAAVCSTAAYVFARLGQPEMSLQFLAQVPPALEMGAPWYSVYGIAACNAAFALWLLNRTEHADIIERNLREKILPADFRSPMRDSRLSLARLCALQGRHDEARQWFTDARRTLDEQGARPLRAIADYDEALMYLRRGVRGDAEMAAPMLQNAIKQFMELGMTGWTQRARQVGRSGSESSL